ncbi:exported hypothetical protein [Mesorhizobium sp. SOD10]|nr:exported hypothetical protein [Mesorhizobium sp. SOD10]
MTISKDTNQPIHEASVQTFDRRGIFGIASAVGAGALLASFAGGSQAVAAAEGATSVIDTALQRGSIKFGVSLSYAPIEMRDPSSGEPTGYVIELAKLLAKSLNVKAEFEVMPFDQLFAAQLAGKFDMAGTCATILPQRAEKVLFCSEPVQIESQVVLLKPGSTAKSLADLSNPDVTIAVGVGSSQEAAAPGIFPGAAIKSLDNQAAIQDVGVGRSDATLLSEFNVADAKKAFPGLTVMDVPPPFIDITTFFMPLSDYRTKFYVDNWLRYQTSHGVLSALWAKYVGNAATAAGIPTTPITSPWIKS